MTETTQQVTTPPLDSRGFRPVRASPPAVFLTLALQAGAALAQPDAVSCWPGAPRLEVSAESSGEARPVCISPGQTTIFSFDAQLASGSVAVEQAEGFTKVEAGPSTLKLVPSERLPLGRPLRMTVRFTDGAAPSGAAFLLVGHAAQAASLVEVHRQERSPESYQQEVRAKEAEVRLCREENARLRAERAALGGLMGPLLSSAMGSQGVASKASSLTVMQTPGGALSAGNLVSYRSIARVLLDFSVFNPQDATPWLAERAMLTLASGRGEDLKVLTLWQQSPIAPGGNQRVIVEAEAPPDGTRGPFTLSLWAVGGQRVVTLENVMFP